MTRTFFAFLIAALSFSLALAADGNLRARQRLLQQKIDESLVNINDITDQVKDFILSKHEESQGRHLQGKEKDMKGKEHEKEKEVEQVETGQKEMGDSNTAEQDQSPEKIAICHQIEMAFQENVVCECSFSILQLKYSFKCTAKDHFNLAGMLTGYPEYKGAISVSPFTLSVKVGAGICLKKATLAVQDAEGDLCAFGNICAGLTHSGFCGCEASIGRIGCSCKACKTNDGNGVLVSCPKLDGTAIDLSETCLLLPFVTGKVRHSSFPPSLARLPSVEKVEEEATKGN